MTSKLIHSTNLFNQGKLTENAWVFFGESVEIGTGENWKTISADEVIDGSNHLLHSGFVDTHCHGGGGFSANKGLEHIKGILDFNQENQVTRTIISLVSDDVDHLVSIAKDCEKLASDSRFVGLHLEGPFLSTEYCGAQNPAALKTPTDEEIAKIAACRAVKSITIAPELFSGAQLNTLDAAGIKLCFGHSSADYEAASEFFVAAIDPVMTHTFNGMKSIHHRTPGPVVAALETGAWMELIADGVHVHPAAAGLIPADCLILVTDAIDAAGKPDGEYDLGGLRVTVKNGVARTESGSLAGSTLLLKDAVRNIYHWNGDLELAAAGAISNPAKAYGVGLNTLSSEAHFLSEL